MFKKKCTSGSKTWHEPQAAYSCSITGFKHKPSPIMRTILKVAEQFKQLDGVITTGFLAAITRSINRSKIEQRLIALLPKLCRFRIPIFSESAVAEHELSIMRSNELTTKIITHQRQHISNENAKKIKSKIKLMKQHHHGEDITKGVRIQFVRRAETSMSWIKNEEASNWLVTISLTVKGYNLTKQLFWDLIRIRYGRTLTRVPFNCEYWVKLDLEHTRSGKKVSFVSLRHNHVGNIKATLFSEVCNDVWVDPQSQKLTGESLQSSAVDGHEVRLDISDLAFVIWHSGKRVGWHFLM